MDHESQTIKIAQDRGWTIDERENVIRKILWYY